MRTWRLFVGFWSSSRSLTFTNLFVMLASLAAQFEMRQAMDSVGCLIKYLGLMGDESNFGQFSITTHDLAQYVRLDAAAVRSLNLAPSPGDCWLNPLALVWETNAYLLPSSHQSRLPLFPPEQLQNRPRHPTPLAMHQTTPRLGPRHHRTPGPRRSHGH
jgi:hypothetical protein